MQYLMVETQEMIKRDFRAQAADWFRSPESPRKRFEIPKGYSYDGIWNNRVHYNSKDACCIWVDLSTGKGEFQKWPEGGEWSCFKWPTMTRISFH